MQSLIINKGFIILEEHFLKFGYHFVINEKDHILFQKKGNDYDFFEIRILNDKIFVSIPIKKSRFQYKTHFISYYEASEYVEMQLLNFEDTKDAQENKEKNAQEEEEENKEENKEEHNDDDNNDDNNDEPENN